MLRNYQSEKPILWNEQMPGSASCEAKMLVETVSSLLPVEKRAVPIKFSVWALEIGRDA